MSVVTIAARAAAENGLARSRLDRPVLVGNLGSGAIFLALTLGIGGPVLFLIGAAYVVAGSVFFAAAYARGALSVRQELFTWVAPWLAAVALWAVVISQVSGADQGTGTPRVSAVAIALMLGTGCYLAWQIVALAIRQLMAWRSGRPVLPASPSP